MQDLFNLYYLYEYMVNHTADEEREEYIYLRNYVTKLIQSEGEAV